MDSDLKIIRRKVNGFVGFANLPKQWHRKSVRRGFTFNCMVIGESGMGKATLINTLFNREVLAPKVDDAKSVDNDGGEPPLR
ncbi:hypothetical protein OXX79_006910, partial [Metschnikowia pulcherrima]